MLPGAHQGVSGGARYSGAPPLHGGATRGRSGYCGRAFDGGDSAGRAVSWRARVARTNMVADTNRPPQTIAIESSMKAIAIGVIAKSAVVDAPVKVLDEALRRR